MRIHSDSLGTDPLPLTNHNPAISSVSPNTENLNKAPQAGRQKANTLNVFNNNTYTNFKTAHKRMLILRWYHAQELFESEMSVTTGGFEL